MKLKVVKNETRDEISNEFLSEILVDWREKYEYDIDGIIVCDEDFSQTYPQIDLYNESTNSYVIYWNDSRSSGKEDLVNVFD